MTTVPVLPVAEPPAIAQLPHDSRGYPIPVHVGRVPGRPVRLSEQDHRRIVLVTRNRLCTICGWSVPENEHMWYVSEPPALDSMKAKNWTTWDRAIEGAGHQECLYFSSIVCPFIAQPGYVRKTAMRTIALGVVAPKGVPRDPVALAGAPEMRFEADAAGVHVLWRGPMVEHRFVDGTELIPTYNTLLAAPRTPSPDDLAWQALLVSFNDDEIHRLAEHEIVRYGAEQGYPFQAPPGVGRNDPCFCGSGTKLKHCCLKLYDSVRSTLR